MNSRTQSYIALMALGALALLAIVAINAAADPADISNPPSADWFFDSGTHVTITGKTWDINYNITVANKTHLTFDSCAFKFYDKYDLNTNWIDVWWNGTMDVKDCKFTSNSTRGYYVIAMGNLTISGSTLSDLTPSYTGGGLTASGCALTLISSTFKAVHGGPAILAKDSQFMADNLTVTNCGDASSRGPAVLLTYAGNDYKTTFDINLRNCDIERNAGVGLRIESFLNRANLDISLSGTKLNENGRNGLEVEWGSPYYWQDDNTNCSIDLSMTDCEFKTNNDLGVWIYFHRISLDGKAALKIDLDTCTLEANNDGGMYIDEENYDGAFGLTVADSTFKDNSLNPQNWNVGGLQVYEWDARGSWNVGVAGTTFEHNGQDGVYISHSSVGEAGPKVNFSTCDFSDNQQAGVRVYLNNQHQYLADFSFDSCNFNANPMAGIYLYQYNLNAGYGLTVSDCTFTASTGGGILSEAGSDYSDGVVWRIEDSTFDGLGQYAINLDLDYVKSGATLQVLNCTINNTGGVRFAILDSVDTSQAVHTLVVKGTTITATNGAAIDAIVYGYFGVEFDMAIDHVVIKDAQFNGLRATASTNYASLARTIDMKMTIDSLVVDTVTGTGVNIGTDEIQYRGTRNLAVHGLTVTSTQKGISLSGLRAVLYNTSVMASLRQDLIVISSDVDLYSIQVAGISLDKFQVIESGSIRFWYDMEIHVMWDTGVRVIDAVVEVMDNHHTLVGVWTQTASEDIPVLELNSYQLRETGLYTRSPFLLNVTYKAVSTLATVQLDRFKNVTVFLADHVPPSVFINDPASGYTQQSLSIKVRGSSFDTESGLDTVELSIDGQNWIPMSSTTSWAYTFTLDTATVIADSGAFVIRARATDLAGNTATTMVTVHVDPFPPDLIVQFPPNDPLGYQTNLKVLTVRGVTEAGATVSVNGNPVSLAGTLFSYDLTLVEGPNTVTVTSADALGNSVTEKLDIILDTKAPYIVLLTPTEGEMFTTSTANVSGQAEENLSISINGFPLDSVHYTAGSFMYALPLVRGENLITVRAVDQAGNVARLTRTVFLDDVPPTLAVSQPTDGSYLNSATITIVGSTDEGALLTIDDEAITLDHGTFRHEIVGVEGKNIIHIVAKDVSGNLASVTMTVTVDTIPPRLDLAAPAQDGESVRTPVYTISGTASGATTVTVNGFSVPVGTNGSFTSAFTLLEGANSFTIVATDAAGSQASITRVIVLDTRAPILIVRIPGLSKDKNGAWVYQTKEGSLAMIIQGNTDSAVRILINGQIVPIGEAGFFEYTYTLAAKADNKINITAVDAAGNTKTINYDIQHQYAKAKAAEGFKVGWALLVLGLIILLLAIAIGYMVVSRAGPYVAEPEEEVVVLVPAPVTEVVVVEEERITLTPVPKPEALKPKEGEEAVHEVKPPTPAARPKTTVPRRPVNLPSKEAPKPAPEDKALDEKGAEADLEAEESDQEGM